ncbi:MAG: heavy metal-responsive transcriptional regulator [Acidobacteria bacterium]|nr:heavy metal-responsive transcriptional regulator [Acidobacteriota bacterium]
MMKETRLLMGEVAAQAGVNRETVRYYERTGLLKRPERTPAGYRVYPAEAVTRIQFIKRAQSLGFSLDEIREIVNLSRVGRSPCSRVRRLLQEKLEDVNQRIAELMEFRQELAGFLKELESVPDQADSSAHICALIELSSVKVNMRPGARKAGVASTPRSEVSNAKNEPRQRRPQSPR